MSSSTLKKPVNRLTIYALLGIFLLQPVVTYLAAPWFDMSETGILEASCTLNGTNFENLPADSELAKLLAEDDFCPALELQDLASSVLEVTLPGLIHSKLYIVGLVDQTARHQHHFLHYSSYASRAPPVFS